jgi:hypothetical protein
MGYKVFAIVGRSSQKRQDRRRSPIGTFENGETSVIDLIAPQKEAAPLGNADPPLALFAGGALLGTTATFNAAGPEMPDIVYLASV